MAAKCPICAKPPLERFKPFCSKRCADIDLNQWFKGGYAIPGGPSDQAPEGLTQNGPDGDED